MFNVGDRVIEVHTLEVGTVIRTFARYFVVSFDVGFLMYLEPKDLSFEEV